MPRNKITDLPPPIGTRASNKIVHPGAPDQKKTRRSPAEAKRLREKDQKAKKVEEERLTQAIKKVATIEDQQRHEDLERETAANHPPTPDDGVEMDILGELEKSQTHVSQHGGNEEDHDCQDYETVGQQTNKYTGEENTNPNIDEGSSEYQNDGDEESESDNPEKSAELVSTKRGKLIGHRAMIVSARSTTTATGTPTRPSPSESNSTKRKNTNIQVPTQKRIKPSIPTGISADWVKQNSYRARMPSSSSTGKTKLPDRNSSEQSTAVARPDDNRMSHYGGLVDDNEYDDTGSAPAEPQTGRQHTAHTKYESLIQITPRHRPLTQKQARDGAKKWTLAHLPAGTSHFFTTVLTPLAREAAGCLEPWATLSVDDVQSLVDRVFGVGKFSVAKGDAWCGLVNYRLNNWRNGFATAACDAVQALINDNPEALGTPDDIAYYVKWTLKIEEQTAPFHWRHWGDGKVKKGLFQTPLIIRTFAEAHFSGLEDLTDPIDDKPIGALLLSVQAVERALSFWSTGVFIADTSPGRYFSADNWGDTVERRKAGDSGCSTKTGTYKVRRATKYLASVENFHSGQWENIFQEAQELLAEGRRKKRRNSSISVGSSSGTPGIIDDDDDDDIILISDSGEESLDEEHQDAE